MAEDGTKAKDKKFFWLRLKRDFFKRHDIRVIESMPNGKDYILFYLKLLCESVDHEGRLRFSEEIPYNADMLATITNTNVDIVKSAIKVFTQLHMMELLDDGTFFMQEVQKMIGSETYWAERKRIQRAKEEGQLMITAGQPETANDKIGQFPIESNTSPTCPSKSKSYIESNSYIKSNIYTPPIIPPTGESAVETADRAITRREIINYLNEKTGKNFKYNSNATNNFIDARLNDGYTVEDFKEVIDNKVYEWKETEQEQYLRPETLFRPSHFESYLNQGKVKKKKTKSSGRDWDNL